MKIGVLCSGHLGYYNLKKLCDYYTVLFVATNSKSKEIIDFTSLNKIKTFVGNPRNGKLINFLKNVKIDVLISVNYLFLIEEDLINFPKKIAFNIHGSLLPKYKGRTPHVWSIINGEKKCGITAHLIEKECDAGDILEQKEIDIELTDTGNDILEKYKILYFPIIQNVLSKLKNSSLTFTKQDKSKSTYFDKRTPEDGRINWDRSAIEVYNWIRAQSYPYPGSFCFYDNQKIVIDWVEFQYHKHEKEIINGKIIKIFDNDVFVKVTDGYIIIKKMRNFNISQLKLNKVLR